jgi:hypothetical protein
MSPERMRARSRVPCVRARTGSAAAGPALRSCCALRGELIGETCLREIRNSAPSYCDCKCYLAHLKLPPAGISNPAMCAHVVELVTRSAERRMTAASRRPARRSFLSSLRQKGCRSLEAALVLLVPHPPARACHVKAHTHQHGLPPKQVRKLLQNRFCAGL